MCRDLELAVPGTYDPNQPIIRIQSIAPSLQVITSKQRPRKLTLMGKVPCASAACVSLPPWLNPFPFLKSPLTVHITNLSMPHLSRVYGERNRAQAGLSLHPPQDS